MRVTLTNVRAW